MRGLNVIDRIGVSRSVKTTVDLRPGVTFYFVDSPRGTLYIKGPATFYTQLTGPSAGAVWEDPQPSREVVEVRINAQVVVER